ncbi:hypothetical protein LTR56_023381 [Elasticomyces elasticus]|nr:hypothetical protein LTR56_023381 [Elasticomyces elasticus]KAK3635079.1 hypothetical protein LTR22_019360 [Elasticomyces elasticus]
MPFSSILGQSRKADAKAIIRKPSYASSTKSSASKASQWSETSTLAPTSDLPTAPAPRHPSLPWESYEALPATHPVFKYPAEYREKLYAKGVGEFALETSSDLTEADPVLKAEFDLSTRGKTYGEPRDLEKALTGPLNLYMRQRWALVDPSGSSA